MLSVPHLVIIFIVALVVFGPEKLPELARNFGKVMAEFKRATGDMRSTFEEHLRELERETDQRRIGGAATVASMPSPSSPSTTAPSKSTSFNAAEPVPGVVPAKPPYDPPDLPSYDDDESYIYKPSAPRRGEERSGRDFEEPEPSVAAEPAPAEPEKHPDSEPPTETVATDGGPRPD